MKNKPNLDRYTKWETTDITITKMELDMEYGQTFIKYTTMSGHTLYSQYQHNVTLGNPITMKINYDTRYDRWRLVEIKESELV